MRSAITWAWQFANPWRAHASSEPIFAAAIYPQMEPMERGHDVDSPAHNEQMEPPELAESSKFRVIVQGEDELMLLELREADHPALMIIPLKHTICMKLCYRLQDCRLSYGNFELDSGTKLSDLLGHSQEVASTVELRLHAWCHPNSPADFFGSNVMDSKDTDAERLRGRNRSGPVARRRVPPSHNGLDHVAN